MLFDEKAVDSIKTFLTSRKETISVAESVTSGFLQGALSTAEKASEFFQGGITTYNLGQKYRHLLIDPINAATCNCVSEKISEEMSLNVCGLFKSNWGIGVTGYAAAVKESENKLFAYYTISLNGTPVIKDKVSVETGEPLEVQLFYVNKILEKFNSYIKIHNEKDHQK